MTPHSIGDVLSAASLMAAIVAILYSLWYPEIGEALRLPWRPFRDDRLAEIAAVRRTLATRAAPLLLASLLPAVVFAPDAFSQATNLIQTAGRPGWIYDSVQAGFLGVYVLVLVLVGVAANQARTLGAWLRKLNAADPPKS